MTENVHRGVLIAGGGPVGLFCALLLGRAGIPVKVFETTLKPQEDPRAATTHPATLELLGEAGLVDDMARVGLVAPIFQFWDRPTGRLVAQFDHALLADETPYPFVIQCEQYKTSNLILERLAALPHVEALFGHEVVATSQSADGVRVVARGPDGERDYTGAYLVGADGGRSIVRKQAGIDFAGFTWPERFIVITTPFDFGARRGYSPRSYFADPKEWCNCFKVSADGPPGLWRTVFPVAGDQPESALLTDEAVQARLQRFFPSDQPYEVVHRNLYVTHQRVAEHFRLGRIVLAGDAAHVNNPIGGMGLNGGFQDGHALAKALIGVLQEGQSDTVLDLYERQRRFVAVDFVQEQTIANKRRLEATDPVARQQSLDHLSATAADPVKAHAFLMQSSMIASQRRAAKLTLETT